MSDGPLVTVAMPLYNGGPHLQDALDLVRNQTYRNLEIILLDNASTDETGAICERAAREDPRVRYVRHPHNIGAVNNFNAALSLKRGEFFMWSAHDDEKSPEFVAECLGALLRHATASMACTWTTLVTPSGEREHHPYSPAISSETLEERVAAFVADTQCVAYYGLYRSAVLDAIGPNDPWLDTDRRFLFKALLRGPFEVVPRPLFRFELSHDADHYLARGFTPRPGAADFDLDLYKHFPQLMQEAGVENETAHRATRALRTTLKQYFDNRATYLIAGVLRGNESRATKIRQLLAWAQQYPPLYRQRIFWGAMRRALAA